MNMVDLFIETHLDEFIKAVLDLSKIQKETYENQAKTWTIGESLLFVVTLVTTIGKKNIL